ncbi:MAG: hypothetical protein C5B59_01405 [Bacteroidetes bacterium]|nr:MAG: hypothetical protein C5B59_01405 [Bacteroidota bacterium]
MNVLVELAEQLKTARQQAMNALGDAYPVKIEPYKAAITRHMACTNLQPLDSTLRLAHRSAEYGADPLLYMAAGMELVLSAG